VADAVATAATTTSTAYTTVLSPASLGPAVTLTVPATGRVLISVTSGMFGSTGSSTCNMSFAMSGANTAVATDTRAVILTSKDLQQASASFVLSGLTPGSTVFTANYKSATGSTCTFQTRSIWAIPLT